MKTVDYNELSQFYKNRRILITGNTGFKGSWLTYLLLSFGAEVTGYALRPPTDPCLFSIAGLEGSSNLNQIFADVRDLDYMKRIFITYKPEIVVHLAAQPIVRESFKNPVDTYSTNVMGTVNICECVRLSKISKDNGGLSSPDWAGVASFLNVTTDKVYKNLEWEYGYRETDELDGLDPYSNSKSCSELVTHSYKESFFYQSSDADRKKSEVKISTARAGNVIGGGDFANDRIIPDCVRALLFAQCKGGKSGKVTVRNPFSTRPYEHVLEPLFVYLLIAARQYEDGKYSGYYNVGPDDQDCVSTEELVELFKEEWNKQVSNCGDILQLPYFSWINKNEVGAPHEANFLKLDCSKLKSTFGWKPRWHIDEAIRQTIQFTKVMLENWGIDEKKRKEAIRNEMKREIEEFVAPISS